MKMLPPIVKCVRAWLLPGETSALPPPLRCRDEISIENGNDEGEDEITFAMIPPTPEQLVEMFPPSHTMVSVLFNVAVCIGELKPRFELPRRVDDEQRAWPLL
jgi:hypothetical protein